MLEYLIEKKSQQAVDEAHKLVNQHKDLVGKMIEAIKCQEQMIQNLQAIITIKDDMINDKNLQIAMFKTTLNNNQNTFLKNHD